MAQAVAKQSPVVFHAQQTDTPTDLDLTTLYNWINSQEQDRWEEVGAREADDGIWVILDGRLMLPAHALQSYLTLLHQSSHMGVSHLAQTVNGFWFAPGIYQAAKRVVSACQHCAKYNQKGKGGGGKLAKPPGSKPWRFSTF